MEHSFVDGFYSFVRKQAKEYPCLGCMGYNNEPKTRKFISSTKAEVTLECRDCSSERVVTITMRDKQ